MRHLLFFYAALLSAQPVINSSSAVNAASYAAPGLPNSALAQGSIFTVFGQNLGPASIVSASSYPLSTTLAGVSAQVTVNGVTVAPIILFALSNQVAMIMPSSTPQGAGMLTITYHGQTSAPVTVQVTAANFGLFALNEGGTGPAVVTDAGNTEISLTHSASPGQTLVLWGTGLGAITADETQPPPQGNIGPKPTVWVGSQQASVLYWGRAGCCGGLDQINFQVPAGISGCYVPVAVQTGDVVSNYGSIAVAGAGSPCSDPFGLTAAQIGQLQNGHNLDVATMSLTRTIVSLNSGSTTTTDSGSASFLRYTPDQLRSSSFNQAVSIGYCMVFPITGSPMVVDPVQPAGLDAGSSVEVGGTNGTVTLQQSSKGNYSRTLGNSFLSVPNHTINIFGGADIGPVAQELQMPPALNWTTQSSSSTLTVNWTGAVPDRSVRITGYSLTAAQGPGAIFYCTAPSDGSGAGQFPIPAPVLLSLPATSGFLGITSIQTPSDPFTITRGIDAGFAQASLTQMKEMTYGR